MHKPSDVISLAMELIPDEDAWYQGAGRRTEPTGTVRRCVEYALLDAASELSGGWVTPERTTLVAAAFYYVESALPSPHSCIASFNDDPLTLFSDVQGVLKSAYHEALQENE